MQRLDTSIRVPIETKQLLEKKKAKLGLKSLNDVVLMLLEKDEEFAIVKKIKRKKSQNEPKGIIKEKPKTELLSLNGKCLFKHEREDGKVDCAKDFREKNRMHVLRNEECKECWNNAFRVPISN